MSTYNMTSLTDQTTLVGMLQILNGWAEGYIGLSICVMVWIILFTWAKSRGDNLEAYINACWITTIVGIILSVLELLDFKYLLGLIVMIAIGMYAMHNRD